MRTSGLGRPWLHQPPAAFAFVMATGIVAAALRDIGIEPVGNVLLGVAVVALPVLLVGVVLRVVTASREVVADLQTPGRAWGFLTVVAAANVVGVGLHDRWPLATLLIAVASAPVWLLLAYGIPAWLILRSEGQTQASPSGVDGTWFLWVVSTQSLAVALATVGGDSARPGLMLGAVALWSIGLVLYLMLTSLALVRLLAAAGRHSGIVPSNWIFMGATAITVLAGATILAAQSTPIVTVTAPAISGMSFVL